MLDTYIKSTAGTAKWVLFILLEFFGPVVRIVLRFFAIGGLLAFVICLVLQSDHRFAKTAMYICLGSGLIGTFLLVSYEMAVNRMYYDRMYPEGENTDEVTGSWWTKFLNWLFVLALFVGFVIAAAYIHQGRWIEHVAIGAVWWLSVGVFLGMCNWLYQRSGGLRDAGVDLLDKMREKGQIKKQAPAVQVHLAANDVSSVVVPFRRRD